MTGEKTKNFYDVKQETMSKEERQNHYNRKLEQIIQYAYRNAPAVRAKLDKAGIAPSQVRTVKDLEKLPVTTKEELIELQKTKPPFGGFLAEPREKLWKIFVSTGPIYDPWGASENKWRVAKKTLYVAGIGKGDLVIIPFSYHLVNAAWTMDETMRQMGITVIPTGVGNTEVQVQTMHQLGVTAYWGTPSFLMALIKRAEELGYDFRRDFALKKALFSGEPYPQSLRDSFEQTYGIDTYQAFGTADVALIAYECNQKAGMHIAEEVIVEIVDPETGKQLGAGETGEMVVTTFDVTYPLIRFGLGDLSYYTDEPCPCGRTSSRLVRFVGRVRDVVRVRGRFIYPKQVQEAIVKCPQVSKYQIVVTRPAHRDEMTLKVELVDETINKEELLQNLHQSIQEICLLKMDKIEFVAKGTIPEERKIIVDERVFK